MCALSPNNIGLNNGKNTYMSERATHASYNDNPNKAHILSSMAVVQFAVSTAETNAF
jgi:hypothetical protein